MTGANQHRGDSNPAQAAEAFPDQLSACVLRALNEVAPGHTCFRRPCKPITKWLSGDEVKQAKRDRDRHLERRLKDRKVIEFPPMSLQGA